MSDTDQFELMHHVHTCPACGTQDGCAILHCADPLSLPCSRCVPDGLVGQAAAYPHLQARAAILYAAYVFGLGPLGEALPPWHDLIDRQQYAWRCVVRVAEERP